MVSLKSHSPECFISVHEDYMGKIYIYSQLNSMTPPFFVVVVEFFFSFHVLCNIDLILYINLIKINMLQLF